MSQETYAQLSRYGMLALLLALFFTPAGAYLGAAVEGLSNLLLSGASFVLSPIL